MTFGQRVRCVLQECKGAIERKLLVQLWWSRLVPTGA